MRHNMGEKKLFIQTTFLKLKFDWTKQKEIHNSGKITKRKGNRLSDMTPQK